MFVRLPYVALAAMLAIVNCSAGLAQDGPQKKSWEQLVKERETAFNRLKEIQQIAPKSTPQEVEKLKVEFRGIVDKLQDELFPQLKEQVVVEFTKNPKDETTREVAQEMTEYSYSQNDFPTTLKLATAIMKADPQDDVAVNFAGVANFAEHNFEDAYRILSLAKKNGQLLGNLGGQYLETSQSYIDYWKKEQEIRAKEAAAQGDAQLPRVKLSTTQGDVVIELFENEAPNTVANFINLVEKNYYDGLKFHRVLQNFMAQGGCPFSKSNPELAGSGGPGYTIKCEAYRPDARRHFSGSLSMAHAGKDTGGSQFFITHLPTPHLDREINPSSVHTVFGRVVEGLDVARAIQKDDVIKSATVIRKRAHDYVPKTTPE